MFSPSTDSFRLKRRAIVDPCFTAEEENVLTTLPQSAVLPSTYSFRYIQKPLTEPRFTLEEGRVVATVSQSTFLPSTDSFVLTRRSTADPRFVLEEEPVLTILPRTTVLPNTDSFVLKRRSTNDPRFPPDVGNTETTLPELVGAEQPKVSDQGKRNFLKLAGIAGAGVVLSQLAPQKAQAFIMGSSPTTGVVGVKNSSNVRINPATEETVSSLLKPSDLTFDTGSLQVKVTSLPAAGSSSFSDSGSVDRKGLVDGDRHVQVDVLSSALPSSASTETTLQTISFGGFKFKLYLDTAGSIDYVGEAAIGTATATAAWRIKKINSASGTVITWAGTGAFDQVWDNRASLSYS